jgi:hypothetical protein
LRRAESHGKGRKVPENEGEQKNTFRGWQFIGRGHAFFLSLPFSFFTSLNFNFFAKLDRC